MMSRQMKASGVDWIGNVPSSWNIVRLKDVCNAPKKAESSDVYVGMEHVEPWGGQYKAASVVQEEPSTFQLLVEGTFCFSKLRPYLAKAFIARESLAASTEFLAYTLTKRVHAPYFLYLTLSPGFIHAVNDGAGGAKMPRINSTIFENQNIGNPTLLEQIAIASYLDDRTTAIDKKIQFLEEKSKSLAELRKSVVHQAVTKGLDLNVVMKPSGVDWIGNVPSHWTTQRVKSLLKEVSIKGFGNEQLLAATQQQGVIPKNMVGWRTVEAKEDGREGFKLVEPGMFVISLRSFEGGIEHSQYRGIISSAYTVLELDKGKKSFFKYLLKSAGFIGGLQVHKKGIRDGQSISYTAWAKDELAVPADEEQIAIANYLDERTNIIDESIKTIADQIAAMKSLRQSLIHEAVTGKIDVADYGYHYA